jgi:hypothetical protein
MTVAPKTYKPVEAVLRMIRNNAAHNTSVCLAYVSDPAPFAALTDKQRAQIHGGACSLLGLKETATTADLQAAAAQAEREGRNPRFSWVHQNYAPYAEPGKARRPSLAKQFGMATAQGMIQPPADFVEVVKAATWNEQGNPKGLILAAPRRGGFILAVKADAEAAKVERAAHKPSKQAATPEQVASWF